MQSSKLQKAINAIKSGDRKTGYQLLVQVIRADPNSKEAEIAWLWMYRIVKSPEKKRQCLNAALKINPTNEIARKQIEQIDKKESNKFQLPAVEDIVPSVSVRKDFNDRSEVKPNEKEIEANQKGSFVSNSRAWIIIFVVLVVGAILVIALIGSIFSENERVDQPVPTIAKVVQIPPTFTPLPTFDLRPTYTRRSIATPRPTNTQTPISVQTSEAGFLTEPSRGDIILPTLTSQPRFVGTEAEFIGYIRNKYSSISGQALDIVDVSVFNESGENGLRSVAIQLSNDSAALFARQSAADATDYGRNLIQDAITYFGGESHLIRVYELFYDDYLSDAYFDEQWYYIGDYSIRRDAWPIYRDYINGYYKEGYISLDVWN